MDDLKDTKKTDQVSKFLDGQSVRTNPFGRNSSGEKAYRRAERIVAALHLLTNHIDSTEPARKLVRETGLRILSEVLMLRDEMRAINSTLIVSVQSSVRELISILRMLAVSGFISTQNAEVVIESLDELGTFLTLSQRSTLSENVALVKEDLMLDTKPTQREVAISPYRSIPAAPKQISSENVKQHISKDVEQTKISSKEVAVRAGKQGDVSSRSRSIIQILRANGELGIRDIASNLPEYSEKMIQRELATLVAGRVVAKSGLKRWSRYSLLA